MKKYSVKLPVAPVGSSLLLSLKGPAAVHRQRRIERHTYTDGLFVSLYTGSPCVCLCILIPPVCEQMALPVRYIFIADAL